MLQQDIESGEQILVKSIRPIGERVRERFPLAANPISPDPSADPSELAGQVADMLKQPVRDILKGVRRKDPLALEKAGAKFLLKPVLGIGYEIFVRNGQRAETRRLRAPSFEAIIAGVARGHDLNDDSFKPKNAFERGRYNAAQKAVADLSPEDRHKLRVFLTTVGFPRYRAPQTERELRQWRANGNAEWWQVIKEKSRGSTFREGMKWYFRRRDFESD